jgi:hypothetical protein
VDVLKGEVEEEEEEYSQDSSVSISTGYGLDSLGSVPGRGKIYFSTPQRPPSLLSDG